MFINNNLLNVDKELKKNKKQEDYGFIPSSWKLVKLARGGEAEKELASGVADFCLVEENGKKEFVYTNGKHIFSVEEGQKRKKLTDVDFCLKVGSMATRRRPTRETFSILFKVNHEIQKSPARRQRHGCLKSLL